MNMLKNLTTAVLATALVATPVSAQLPHASGASLGLGFNTTASARGFAAVASNPAGLAHPESPGFSMAIPALTVGTGLGPVTLSDLYDYENQLVPLAVKDTWLQNIVQSGGQRGTVDVGATALALSAGSIGFQLSARAAGVASLDPDAAELLLYGNKGRTGDAGDFDLGDSHIRGYMLTTAALSFAFQPTQSLYVGVTGKYVIGNGLVAAQNTGSQLTSNPIVVDVEFPIMYPFGENTDYEFNQGSGVGMDVGAIWEGAGPTGLTVGATLQNVFNTFEWDLAGYVFTPGEAIFDGTDSQENFDEAPLDTAPTATQELFQSVADELTLPMIGSVGVQLDPTSYLRLQGDLRKTLTDGIEFEPDFHMGVGAELRIVSFLPLRAHGAIVSGGVQVGGGGSLVLGPVNLTGAVALRDLSDAEDTVLAALTLSFGAN